MRNKFLGTGHQSFGKYYPANTYDLFNSCQQDY